MNPTKLLMNAQMRKAKEMKKPAPKIVVLNPILYASLTPKESMENIARPRMGKTRDMVVRVTLESYSFK
jgi:hypothetical protein